MLVGGTTSVDADGVVLGSRAYEQTVEILRKIEHELRRAGASLADVIQTRFYVTDICRSDEVGRAHGEVFGELRPLMTMVQVSALIDPRMLVEIEAVALVSVETRLAGVLGYRPCAIMTRLAAVAQLAEQRTFNPKVVGSIPTGGMEIAL